MSLSLRQDLQLAYDRLIKRVDTVPISKRKGKVIEGTAGTVSVSDLIAYQIGWGKCLIRWYEAGVQGEAPEMPGDGFSKWDYLAIAKCFYEKYGYDGSNGQLAIFEEIVSQILKIIEKEEGTGNLDQEGIWSWCTLSSGKKWPLSKWIRVNTISPYKRAAQLIKKVKWI